MVQAAVTHHLVILSIELWQGHLCKQVCFYFTYCCFGEHHWEHWYLSWRRIKLYPTLTRERFTLHRWYCVYKTPAPLQIGIMIVGIRFRIVGGLYVSVHGGLTLTNPNRRFTLYDDCLKWGSREVILIHYHVLQGFQWCKIAWWGIGDWKWSLSFHGQADSTCCKRIDKNHICCWFHVFCQSIYE